MARWLGAPASQALGLTLALWFVFVYGTYLVSEVISGRFAFLYELPLDVPAVLLVALVAYLIYPVVHLTRSWPPLLRCLAVGVAVVPISAVQAIINVVENWLLGVVPSFEAEHHEMIRTRMSKSFLSHLYLSFANGVLLMLLQQTRQNYVDRAHRAEAEALAERAHSVAQRLQLNPHFLFNTLNSISSLVVTDRAAPAEEMITRLSDFLRLSLETDPTTLVPLSEEIAVAEAYLNIEAVRFGRMEVEIVCPCALAKTPVPGFLLQPLVENAVKYGIAQASGTARIRIAATEEAGSLAIEVSNDRLPGSASAPPPGLGIGHANIRDRLARRYGARGGLTIQAAGEWYTALVRLPLPSAEPDEGSITDLSRRSSALSIRGGIGRIRRLSMGA